MEDERVEIWLRGRREGELELACVARGGRGGGGYVGDFDGGHDDFVEFGIAEEEVVVGFAKLSISVRVLASPKDFGVARNGTYGRPIRRMRIPILRPDPLLLLLALNGIHKLKRLFHHFARGALHSLGFCLRLGGMMRVAVGQLFYCGGRSRGSRVDIADFDNEVDNGRWRNDCFTFD